MLAIPLKSVVARLGLAVGTSVVLVVGSLPGSAAANPTRTHPGHVDEVVSQKASAEPSSTIRVIITRDQSGNDDSDVRNRGGNVVQRLQLGNASVDVLLRRHENDVAVNVLERHNAVRVVVVN